MFGDSETTSCLIDIEQYLEGANIITIFIISQ